MINSNGIQPASLQALARYATTYEVVAILPDGSQYRLGFTKRPSLRSFMRLAREHSTLILPHLGDAADKPASYTAAGGLVLGPVIVRKSGRTERECAQERDAFTTPAKCEGCDEPKSSQNVYGVEYADGSTGTARWCHECAELATNGANPDIVRVLDLRELELLRAEQVHA